MHGKVDSSEKHKPKHDDSDSDELDTEEEEEEDKCLDMNMLDNYEEDCGGDCGDGGDM